MVSICQRHFEQGHLSGRNHDALFVILFARQRHAQAVISRFWAIDHQTTSIACLPFEAIVEIDLRIRRGLDRNLRRAGLRTWGAGGGIAHVWRRDWRLQLGRRVGLFLRGTELGDGWFRTRPVDPDQRYHNQNQTGSHQPR
jgi:hypothetical protein